MFKRVFHNATGGIMDRWLAPSKMQTGKVHFSSDVPALSTGFSQLDKAIGFKGLPLGCITELVGANNAGLLAMAAGIAARVQRKQQPVSIIDMAGQFDQAQTAQCGLVAPELLLHKPATAFEWLRLMEQSARQPGLVIVNLGFTPQTFGAADKTALSMLLSRLRRITHRAACAFLYLTKPEEVDPFIHTNYPPGFPLNEAADVRLWIQQESWVWREHQVGGYKCVVTVIKNELATSGKGANIKVPFIDPEIPAILGDFDF